MCNNRNSKSNLQKRYITEIVEEFKVANYTFYCKTCGHFTEWHQSMKGNKQQSICPECNAVAKRVFMPPITFRMNSTLKRTIEEGMEPKLVKKEDMPKTPLKSKPRLTRPWQAGH